MLPLTLHPQTTQGSNAETGWPIPPWTQLTRTCLQSHLQVLVGIWQTRSLCSSKVLQMCYQHWNSPTYCSKEVLVWCTRDYYHVTLHLGPSQGWSHQPDQGWQLVVQCITCPKTPSGACTKYWCLCLALLHKLHTIKWHHSHYCIPNPGCDLAVCNKFGLGTWMWIFDSPIGYHQLVVSPKSWEKLAFQGVDAIKWTYTVMPFGPTNKPATFSSFIHDINSIWKELAKQNGLPINNNMNTHVIVDDVVSWTESLTHALADMQCQLKVCQA